MEETIAATLDANGQLRLSHQPNLPPGPVQVTIRPVPSTGPLQGLAEVMQEIAAGQRARGSLGRSTENLLAEEQARLAEDEKRDQEFEAARQASQGKP